MSSKHNNITIKIIAISFAIILWTYVMSEVNPRINKEIKGVKVNYLNLETVQQTGLVLMEPEELTIDVKVVGRRNDILNVTADDIIAQVDLRGYSEGLNKVPIDIQTPYNVEIEDFSPKQALFKFDTITQKQLPVVIKTTGSPSEGYSVGKGKVNPEFVYIKGPKTWVNSVSSVVATVDVDGLTNDVETSVPIKAIDDNGKEVRGVEKEPNVVNVLMPILKMKNVTVEPILEGEPLVGYRITKVTSNPITVKIRGYENVLNNIETLKTVPINIDYLSKNIQREIPFDLPEGIEIVDYFENPIITIEIEKIVQKSFEFSIKDIRLLNLKSNLELDTSNINRHITITVEGVESVINQLTSDALAPYINLEGLDAGAHIVNIELTQPQNVDILKITPSELEVTIEEKQVDENGSD